MINLLKSQESWETTYNLIRCIIENKEKNCENKAAMQPKVTTRIEVMLTRSPMRGAGRKDGEGYFCQAALNYLIRDLDLSRGKAKLLGSQL